MLGRGGGQVLGKTPPAAFPAGQQLNAGASSAGPSTSQSNETDKHDLPSAVHLIEAVW